MVLSVFIDFYDILIFGQVVRVQNINTKNTTEILNGYFSKLCISK